MIEEFQRIGRLLFDERLVGSHGGSLSLREGDKIFVTVKDAMLADLKKNDIIQVGLEPGDKDDLAPPEIAVYRALYKQSEITAIVHAQPANSIAISITDNKIMPQDSRGINLYKSAPIVRVRDGAGSDEAARLVPNFLAKENVVAVLKGSGSLAVGGSLEQAYMYTSALENSCRVIVAVRSSGGRQQSGGSRPSGSRVSGGRHGGMMGDRRNKGGYKSAIPPGIGVMDRSRDRNRNR